MRFQQFFISLIFAFFILGLASFSSVLAQEILAEDPKLLPQRPPSSILQIGSYTITVLTGKDVVNASSDKVGSFPGFQLLVENSGPQYLLVHDGKKVRIEDLETTSSHLIAMSKGIVRKAVDFFPRLRNFSQVFGKIFANADEDDEPEPGEIGVGLIISFFLGNWLFLIFGCLVMGQRVWMAGDCIRKSPIRSIFFSSFAVLGIILTLIFLSGSLIGLPMAIFVMIILWIIGILSIGAASTAITGVIFQPVSIFWKLFLLAFSSPIILLPLVIPNFGPLLTMFLLLFGFGGLILSGFEVKPGFCNEPRINTNTHE